MCANRLKIFRIQRTIQVFRVIIEYNVIIYVTYCVLGIEWNDHNLLF